MTTFHSNTDGDFDRIYKYLRKERKLGPSQADSVIDGIYADAELIADARPGKFRGLEFYRARLGYLIWYVERDDDAQVYAVYHRREDYAEAIEMRADVDWE